MLFLHAIMFLFYLFWCVRFTIFSPKPRDWLGRTSTK